MDNLKPYRLGRPTGSTTLFPRKEYVIIDCLLRMLQIQLHEVANSIFNATGSSFCLETLCRVVYRLGKKAYACNIYEFLLRCAFNLILIQEYCDGKKFT